MDVGVHVDQNALRSQTLRTVRGDGVAVIEVPHLCRIKGNRPVLASVHADSHRAGLVNLLHGSKVAVGDSQFTIGRGELQTVAYSKFALDLAVSGDTVQTGRIVGDLLAIRLLDGKKI